MPGISEQVPCNRDDFQKLVRDLEAKVKAEEARK